MTLVTLASLDEPLPQGQAAHMALPLEGKRVAALVTDGFEVSELFEPRQALEAAGARVDVIAPHAGRIHGWKDKNWDEAVDVDRLLDDVHADEYDALLLPGGVMNPDSLRMNPKAVGFIQQSYEAGKPIAAICHGLWTLIDAGVTRGVRLTSWPSLRTDLTNAGAEWVDEEVVVDRGIVSSRKPADLPAFNQKMLEEFAEGTHAGGNGRPPSKWMKA